MNAEQLRELDAWIGIRLFDMHEFHPAPSNKDVCANCSHRVGFEMHFVPDWAEISDQLPHYTTDPAAAMMVLARCVGETTASIRKQSSGNFCVWWTDTESMKENHVFGDTLPAAVCLFAKKLFEQQTK